jgi:hypothetical protein
MFVFVDAIAATPRRRSAFRHQSGKPKRTATTDFAIEASALIEALDSVVGLDGRVLEPAAGKGHMAAALRTRGLTVVASDLNVYENPLIPDIARKDLREIDTLKGFAWTITNLPYSPHRYHDELAAHLPRFTPRAPKPTAHKLKPIGEVVGNTRPLPPPEPPRPRLLIDLDWRDCRWPTGAMADGRHLFCGQPQAPGRPYCERHCGAVSSSASSFSLRALGAASPHR